MAQSTVTKNIFAKIADDSDDEVKQMKTKTAIKKEERKIAEKPVSAAPKKVNASKMAEGGFEVVDFQNKPSGSQTERAPRQGGERGGRGGERGGRGGRGGERGGRGGERGGRGGDRGGRGGERGGRGGDRGGRGVEGGRGRARPRTVVNVDDEGNEVPEKIHRERQPHAENPDAPHYGYEKRSGTGRGSRGEKKDGHGKGNWGDRPERQYQKKGIDAEAEVEAAETPVVE